MPLPIEPETALREALLRTMLRCGIAHNNKAGGQWVIVATDQQLDKLVAALSVHPALDKGGEWVSVKEREPREGERVFACWAGGGRGRSIRISYILDNSKTTIPWKGWRVPSGEVCPLGKVSHWMPISFPSLPAAPEIGRLAIKEGEFVAMRNGVPTVCAPINQKG